MIFVSSWPENKVKHSYALLYSNVSKEELLEFAGDVLGLDEEDLKYSNPAPESIEAAQFYSFHIDQSQRNSCLLRGAKPINEYKDDNQST